jgi:hypothetical protein
MPKQLSRLVFYSDDIPPVEIFGYVEDYNVNPFSRDVEIQVSIICPYPYFTAVNPTVVTGQSTRDNSNPVEIEYNGSIDTGINVELTRISDPAPTFVSIQSGDPSISTYRVTASVSATTYFLMNSIPGQRYAQNVSLSTGVITNLLSKIIDGSTWPTLQPGTNDFSVITDQGAQDWQLTYFELYGGL